MPCHILRVGIVGVTPFRALTETLKFCYVDALLAEEGGTPPDRHDDRDRRRRRRLAFETMRPATFPPVVPRGT